MPAGYDYRALNIDSFYNSCLFGDLYANGVALGYTEFLTNMNIRNTLAMISNMGPTNPLIINPAAEYEFPESVLPLRKEEDITRGLRMPPSGSVVVDTAALHIIKYWSGAISFCP
ncbi:MAG: hypothetical protein L0Z73_00820 [Gammaproteobacteria bacterium]|nr:hypothetical protein [Gammaproteobacteria bacterium]